MLRFLSLTAIAAFSTAFCVQEGAAQAPAADAPKLTIGDKAPQPALKKVVKGEFPDKFEDDKVYVVEFWATWCPPCRDSMPHLTKLQAKYKDQGVHILGVSDETVEKVNDFIGKGSWPQKTQYTIAVDDDRKTSSAYMRASGQSGIPTAFIVGKTGHLEWIGHPMSMDEPLAQVVAGTWDRAAAKEDFEKSAAFELKMQKAQQEMMQAYGQEDWDGMLKIMTELQEAAPSDMKPFLEMQKFQILLTMANEPERAYKIGNQMVTQYGDTMDMMNQLAWTIATAPGLENRDLKLALTAARAGVKASDGKDASMLDTLATVLWESGDKKEAITTQRKAVDMTDNPDAKAEFEAKIAEWEAEMSSAG